MSGVSLDLIESRDVYAPLSLSQSLLNGHLEVILVFFFFCCCLVLSPSGVVCLEATVS